MSSKGKSSAETGGGAALLPKLRFPEFRDASAWKNKPLSEVLSPVVRERLKPAEPYTGLGLRSHGKGTFLKEKEDPAKNSMDVLFEVKRDDLIVNITFAWEGAIAIAGRSDDGTLVSHRFPTYAFKKGKALPEFFRYRILEKQFVYNLGVISPGGAGRNRVMSKTDFLKLKVWLPDIGEQQKIADCLDSADALIAAQGRKVEALKAHKKGLMQQLFPQEGETQPRLRFPEFQQLDGWTPMPMGEVYSFRGNNSLSRDKLNYSSGSLKNIHYGDIHKKFSTHFDLTKELVPFVNNAELGAVRDNSFCSEGDLVFADASEDLADIGKCIEITNLNNEQVVAGLHTILARPVKKKVAVGFGGHLFKFESVRRQIQRVAQGTKVLGISPKRLHDIRLPLPTLQEQQKIADCLTSLDDLIAAETRKLDTLRGHKKALMQQLFPSVGGDDA